MSAHDDYLAKIEWQEGREALERLRAIIREEVPDATEVISYGMPGFSVKGSAFIWYAAFKNHCSLFAATTGLAFADELTDYKTSKGTIQFLPSKPLPEDLVRRITRARLAEHLAQKEKKKR